MSLRPARSLGELFDALPPELQPTLLSGLDGALNGETAEGWRALEVNEVTIDPFEVSAEVPILMIARSCWYRDTHDELLSCLERGARALLVSRALDEVLLSEARRRGVPVLCVPQEDPTLGLLSDAFYGAPTASLKVYGVTGTNGKTSTVSFLAELLEGAGERVAVMGTLAYRFEQRSLSAPNTTPDALVIHRFARDALDLGATALALEVSSHALTLARVAGVRFDAVGFTNLSRDHLDFHGTFEAYRDAKAKLFGEHLTRSLKGGKRVSAVVFEGAEGAQMLAKSPKEAQLISCNSLNALEGGEVLGSLGESGRDEPTHELNEASRAGGAEAPQVGRCLVAICGEPSARGVTLTAQLPHGERLSPQQLPLIGDYHPANISVALGMLWGTHHNTPERLSAGWARLASSAGVSGRMELAWSEPEPSLEPRSRGRVALVDYAHTPEAVSRALEALSAVHKGERWALLGCGGDRDRGKRPLMTRAALEQASVVYLTSDNPRSEPPAQILHDALEGLSGEDRARVVVIEGRREAIEAAWRALPSGGALLIAGKGHERYQERQVFDERRGVSELRRFALSDVEALRAAALAEREGCAAAELPLYKSALNKEGLPLSPIELIYEAGSREGGLSVALVVGKGAEGAEDRWAHVTATQAQPLEGSGDQFAHELAWVHVYDEVTQAPRLSVKIRLASHEPSVNAARLLSEGARALTAQTRLLRFELSSEATLKATLELLNQGISERVRAHLGERALGEFTRSQLMRDGEALSASLTREGWRVHSAQGAFVPTLKSSAPRA